MTSSLSHRLPDGRCSPERRSVGGRSVIDAAKAAVPTIALANFLCGPGQMRRTGERWAAVCPLPGHDEKTPSFTVYPGDRGWWCYGCQRGGDVVDLARFAWSIDRADVAAAEALMTFGHPIPPRPGSWFRRQERQKPVRDAIEEARQHHVTRRVFRIFVPMLEEVTDPDERREETELLWDAAYRIAEMVRAGRWAS